MGVRSASTMTAFSIDDMLHARIRDTYPALPRTQGGNDRLTKMLPTHERSRPPIRRGELDGRSAPWVHQDHKTGPRRKCRRGAGPARPPMAAAAAPHPPPPV